MTNSHPHPKHHDMQLANGRMLPCSQRVLVMGILNCTPDSFSDGGRFFNPEAAAEHARAMVAEGAEIIDIGGESTRPGSSPVPAEEQVKRIIPAVKAIRAESQVAISIDTTLRPVAEAALDAGADIINDISALRGDADMASLVAERKIPIILMHMLGEPRTMQQNPMCLDVAKEVRAFLAERMNFAIAKGIARENIILDPGFGFGKRVQDNLELLAKMELLSDLGAPLLVGYSRKSTIGQVLDLPVEERLEGSLACHVLAVAKGARILRVHDVKETVRATRMAEAVLNYI